MKVVWALLLTLGIAITAQAQAPARYEETRRRAFELYDQGRMVDALPLLEELNVRNPSDTVVLSRLAFATFVSAAAAQNPDDARKIRKEARTLALKAVEQGDRSPLTRVILDAISEDGVETARFSDRPEVEAAMREGESAFAKGDFTKALAAYERALQLDPAQYEAALFIGDVYYKQKQMNTAGEWFARAIKIDPDRETAYRYWGDALMVDGKARAARDRFIDAVIAEPFNRTSWIGLIQWADRNRIQLGHLQIDTPKDTVRDKGEKGVEIVVDFQNAGDGSLAWIAYSGIRAAWMNGKFAESFPQEKAYRHSLAEEAEALRATAKLAKTLVKEGKVKKDQLNVSLANLIRIEEAGLVDAYILLARPDEGIANDYELYRKENRDKLRKYLTDYVASEK